MGNRTCELPVYSAVPQPTEPPLRHSPSCVLLDIYNVPLDSSATYKTNVTIRTSNDTRYWNVWRTVASFSDGWKVAIDCSCS